MFSGFVLLVFPTRFSEKNPLVFIIHIKEGFHFSVRWLFSVVFLLLLGFFVVDCGCFGFFFEYVITKNIQVTEQLGLERWWLYVKSFFEQLNRNSFTFMTSISVKSGRPM